MAVITFYKIKVDTVLLEEQEGYISKDTQQKYKNPLYTTSIFRASFIRSHYGERIVTVDTGTVDIDWKPVDWEKMNDLSV